VGIDAAKNFLPLTNFTPTSIVPDDHPGMAIVNSHLLLYLAGISEAAVLGFAIDAGTGNLTSVPGSPFSTNANFHDHRRQRPILVCGER
jgi:hypothetical protein